MRYVVIALMLLFTGSTVIAEGHHLLTKEEARMLIMNTPAALQIECRGGCVDVELIREGKEVLYAQLRNGCPTAGSGMVDNYTVDLRTGRIWTGIDDKSDIDSKRLRQLRTILLSRA